MPVLTREGAGDPRSKQDIIPRFEVLLFHD